MKAGVHVQCNMEAGVHVQCDMEAMGYMFSVI